MSQYFYNKRVQANFYFLPIFLFVRFQNQYAQRFQVPEAFADRIPQSIISV